MHRDVSHSAQKRKPGIGLFPGTGCPGCAWILGLLYWTGNARQDRARHWYSGGGCGDMGLFGSPQAAWRLEGPWFLILRVVFFGSAAVALFAASQRVLGVVFTLVFVVNLALIYAWGQ